MNGKYTPGPWKAEISCVWGGKSKNTYVAATQTGLDEEEQKANARLIASAPELLGALKSLYTAHKFALETGAKYEVDQYAIDVMKETIAKAEGAHNDKKETFFRSRSA